MADKFRGAIYATTFAGEERKLGCESCTHRTPEAAALHAQQRLRVLVPNTRDDVGQVQFALINLCVLRYDVRSDLWLNWAVEAGLTR